MGDGYFEVQLEKLDKVGAKQLPEGADAYGTAKALVDGTEVSFEGELFDCVNKDVDSVRGQFVEVFHDIEKELRRAAKAILEIARRYREADGQDDETPSVPSPAPQPGGYRKSPGTAVIDIEADLNHLADLLGQLVPQTDHWTQDWANGLELFFSPGSYLIGGTKPVTDGANAIAGHALVPYPVDKLRAAFGPPTEGSAEPAERLRDSFDAARTALIEDFEVTIGSVKDTITDWSGDTAENFKDYVANVVDAKDLQVDALKAAWAIMDMYAQVISTAHSDVQDLLDVSISQAEARLSGKRSEQVDGVVTAVSTAVTAGAASVSSIVKWAAEGLAKKELKAAFKSDEELPGAIIEAANALQDAISDRVDECQEQLNTLLGVLGGGELTEKVTQVKPEEPLILNGAHFDPAEFGLPDDLEPAGVEDKVDTKAL